MLVFRGQKAIIYIYILRVKCINKELFNFLYFPRFKLELNLAYYNWE